MKDIAMTLYREVLDALSRHMVQGNVERCLHYLHLPFRMHLLDRTHVCTTRDDIVHLVQSYSSYLKKQNVTDLRRTVEDARFLRPDLIEGFHITDPLSNGVSITEPYAIRSVLKKHGDRWLSTEQECVVMNQDWRLIPRPRGSVITALPQNAGGGRNHV